MSDLDLGTLTAKLRLEGAREYNRDIDRARSAFADLADQARTTDRQISQIQSPRSMQDIRRDSGQAQGSLNDLGTQGRRTSDQLRGVGDGMGQARRSISDDTDRARRDLRNLGDEGRRAGEGIREGAEEGGNAFSGMLSGLNDRISDRMGEGGESGGATFIAGFGSKIAGLASKAGPVGMALAAVVGLGAIAGAKLADAVMDGMNMQQDRAIIQARFGLSDAQMVQVGKAAGAAFGNGWGESVEANMSAAGAAMQSGLIKAGASAADMDPLLEKLNMVTDVMGEEIPAVTRSAGQLMKTGLARDGSEALDLIYKGQVNNLNVSEDWLDTIDEYSTQFRSLGLTGQEAFGLLSQGVKAGARDTDVVADALKEMSLRVADGTAQADQNFNLLGISAEEMQTKMAAGGAEARDAIGQIFTGLQKIQDPTDRYNAALALFGTKAEDMKAAVNGMDLSKAAAEFRNTGLSADEAAQKLDTPAAKLQAARNKITVAANDIKLKLAEAFAPEVGKMADWVSAHQQEIVQFFQILGVAAMKAGAGVAFLMSAWLHGAEFWLKAAAGMANSIDPILMGFQALGSALSHLPGQAGDMGRALENSARSARETMAPSLQRASESVGTLADGMYGLGQSLNRGADSLASLASQAGTSTQGMQHLANSIVGVPDAKSVIISDNSPAVIDQLTKLGLKVTTLPNGQLRVDAETQQAEVALQALTKTRSVEVVAQLNASQLNSGYGINGLFPKRAAGGQVFGPGGPRDDAFLVALSNREWVQPVDAVDYYGNAFMADVQQRRFPRVLARGFADGGQVGGDTGYGLPSGTSISYGSGGFPDWVTKLGEEHHVKPSTYAGHQESDRAEAGYAPNPGHLNRGIDWSGSVDEMQAFAEYLVGIAPSTPTLEQVIWMNPNTGQKIGWHGRSPDTDGSYFASDYGGHTDHVHMRASGPVGVAAAANGQQPQGIQDITLTAQSSREDVARKIIAEGRKRGYTDAEIADILSDAIQESNLDPEAQNGNWKGIFQQDSSYPGRDDPNTQITGFYDRLDEKKKTPGWSQSMDENIFWVQQRPGESSAQTAVANGRGAYMDEMNAHQDEATKMVADLGPSVGTLDTTGAGATPSGATQNVYVTGGRLDSVGTTSTPTTTPTTPTTTPAKDDPSKLKPSGPLPFVAYAEGGWNGPDAAQMLNNANAWITLAGEAGREAFIPMDGSDRSKGLWLQAGRELGMVRAYAGGGFGGYAEDTSDWMAPKSWMDYAYLAAGAGFTAASVIGPYAQMAAAGQVTLGDLAPQPSTSSNDIPGLGEALSKAVEPLSQQLEELRKDVRDGKTVHIVVQDVKGLLEKTGIHLAAM
ncbi:phage tail tape measure protein [Gordonia sp. N1V]|uniref:phage tail tape measure protein n=1 Tax=Gordonia sp. N1V TaxID=3034163 RepID=UPI0023E2CF90|nr:phage tail tape measure protein [Gordonia sp. N1V]MDF3280488.1 phage tail tape measure protein [Gordonia sp. N1V]